ncbi:zinc-ribbon domain containing protein [Mitsuaria sp. 7]|uniref:zinc-ribbon domain containing protein n=1 Tax=Mitsuaria sp. 7 TaxID=1658665 RepID=UPI0009EE746C|nr:zinc-ribbon domain containing protein [Mitsuaria sp. 7]
MSKMRRYSSILPPGIVPHPRYGSRPIASGIATPEAEIRDGFWGLNRAVIFPEAVLVADASRQNYSIYPRRYYVDILRDCRECGRPFLFFAQEQRHWFEELQFYVDADCVHCSECRARRHDAKTQLARFSAAMKAVDLSRKDLMTLIDDAADLLQAGAVSNLSKLGALKNRALRECGEYPGTLRLAQVLDEAHRG